MTDTTFPKDLFWTSATQVMPNLYDKPFTTKKLKYAMNAVDKIQKSNTLIEFVKNIESVIKKWKITQIKVMQNDYIPEWELIISYNLNN